MLPSKLTTDIAVVEAGRRGEQTSGDAKASPAPESVLEKPADAQAQSVQVPGATIGAGQQRPILPLLRQKLASHHCLGLLPFLRKEASIITGPSDQALKDLSVGGCTGGVTKGAARGCIKGAARGRIDAVPVIGAAVARMPPPPITHTRACTHAHRHTRFYVPHSFSHHPVSEYKICLLHFI